MRHVCSIGFWAQTDVSDGDVWLGRLGNPRQLFLSPDDLRWLCTIAGPALLNELAKGEGR